MSITIPLWETGFFLVLCSEERGPEKVYRHVKKGEGDRPIGGTGDRDPELGINICRIWGARLSKIRDRNFSFLCAIHKGYQKS